jgi:hypothetical protein
MNPKKCSRNIARHNFKFFPSIFFGGGGDGETLQISQSILIVCLSVTIQQLSESLSY